MFFSLLGEYWILSLVVFNFIFVFSRSRLFDSEFWFVRLGGSRFGWEEYGFWG